MVSLHVLNKDLSTFRFNLFIRISLFLLKHFFSCSNIGRDLFCLRTLEIFFDSHPVLEGPFLCVNKHLRVFNVNAAGVQTFRFLIITLSFV